MSFLISNIEISSSNAPIKLDIFTGDQLRDQFVLVGLCIAVCSSTRERKDDLTSYSSAQNT